MDKDKILPRYFSWIILIFLCFIFSAYPSNAARPPYTIKIMPLGDSITYGITFPDLGNNKSVGYRQKLYLDLKGLGYKIDFVGQYLTGESADPGFDFDHEGLPGRTDDETAAGVFNWLKKSPADIVLLHIGTNDLDNNPSAVEQILIEIDEYSRDVIVILARIINRQTYSATTTSFNNNVEAMARGRILDGDKIVIVDMESALNYPGDLADDIHPNEIGYKKMADVWLDALLSLYEDNIGTFRKGAWYLDSNGNDRWDNDIDTIGSFGLANDIPVTGDWNGDGKTNVGVFRNGVWYLDANGNHRWDPFLDTTIKSFGLPNDIPVTGDWNGDGKTNVGVFRNGVWYLDANGNHRWDPTLDRTIRSFGYPTDTPVTGDWNGDGKTKAGVFRNGSWYLDYNGNGRWDPGVDIAILAPTFGYSTDIPVTGDWNGDGKTNIGIFRKGAWYLDFNGNNKWDAEDITGLFGRPDDIPIVGLWKKKPF